MATVALLAVGPPQTAVLNAAVGTTAQGGIGIQLLQAPVALRSDPRAQLYIIDHLHPGEVIHRSIAVTNTSALPQLVSLYAGGAQIVNDEFVPGPNNDLTGWMAVVPSSVELQPNSRQTAEVTITVPPTARDGETYAVVWAQVELRGSFINQISRVGIRTYLDVGPGGYPATSFRLHPLSAATTATGRTVITTEVDNTGSRAIDVSGTLVMTPDGGTARAIRYQLDRNPTIPPHSSAGVAVTVGPHLPAGHFQVAFSVTADTVSHTNTGRLVLGPHGTVMIENSSSSSDINDIVGGTGAVAAVMAASGLAVRKQRRRRQRRGEPSRNRGRHLTPDG